MRWIIERLRGWVFVLGVDLIRLSLRGLPQVGIVVYHPDYEGKGS